jgi:hypothetical protein
MVLGTQSPSTCILPSSVSFFCPDQGMEVLPNVRGFNAPPDITYVLDDPKLRFRYFFSPFFFIDFSTHELFL